MDETISTAHHSTQSERSNWSLLATLLLVGLGDYLILNVVPGLGWFVFICAIVLVTVVLVRCRPQYKIGAVAISVLTALPLVEEPSLLGICLALVGLALAALLASGILPDTFERAPSIMLRWFALMPFRLFSDGVSAVTERAESGLGWALLHQAAGWLVPLAFFAIFLWLFIAANPLIDIVASRFQFGDLELPHPVRLFAWVVLAAVVWALLRPRLLRARSVRVGAAVASTRESALFGCQAILRSLVIFNAMFAVQSILDLTYLWGGMALPEGLSYADYAHRGAFPLIATALLAAGFVLAAMRRHGPGIESRLIRWLVYAWIAQNLLLCISSILRLDLYVESYSLTEMRIAAGVWMGLVAIGLLLILLRIALRRSNGWLIATNLTSLGITLYACAWVDFSALISDYNVTHSRELSGRGLILDLLHLRSLGPTAIPAIDRYVAKTDDADAKEVRAELSVELAQEPSGDWRSWTWRTDRLGNYLDRAAGKHDNQQTLPF